MMNAARPNSPSFFMNPPSYSKSPPTESQIDVLKARMSLMADRNPSWKIGREDWKSLWPLFAAQRITYLYDDELWERFQDTDFKSTGKGEELLDAYMIVDEDSEIQLKLFQFKFSEQWKAGISTKELYSFVERMNRVFLKTDLQDEETLTAFREIQQALLQARGSRRGAKRVRVHCYYVTNGQGSAPTDAPKLDQLRDMFAHDRQAHGFTFETYSSHDFYNLCVHGRIPVRDEVIDMNNDMGDRSFLHHNIGMNPNGMPIQVMVGFVNVNQLIRLVDRYSNNELFEKNVRFFLGSGKDVNRNIISTVTSRQSSWFGFMNNGVSIVADSAELLPPPSGGRMKIRLTNMQIINGCQTVNALYHAKYDPGLKDHFQGNSDVMIRVYQVDPANTAFLNALIIATNSQNAIRPEDLLATDPKQTRAQELFAKFGIFYQRKDGETPPSGSQMLSFSKEQAALSWLALHKGYTSRLRNSSSKREVFSASGEYDEIFGPFGDEELTASPLHRALELASSCLIFQMVANKVASIGKTKRDRGPLPKAIYFLTCGIGIRSSTGLAEVLAECESVEPSSVPREKLKRECQRLVEEHFAIVSAAFTDALKTYLAIKGGSEDSALKNSSFAEAFEQAVRATQS
jgi:hypothetical protein